MKSTQHSVLNHKINGVGTGYGAYETSISKENDNALWRILYKGYMGSKYTDWNLECDDDLYTATKIAIHSYIEKIPPKAKYILGTRSVDGNSVEEIQRRGAKVLDIAHELYDYGLYGIEKYEEPKIQLSKNGEETIQKINNKEYYIEQYKISTNKQLESYELSVTSNIKNLQGKILDSQNNYISDFNQSNIKLNQKELKIAIPIEDIKQDIELNINIENALINTNPIYHCKSSIITAQSYVTYTGSYEIASTKIKTQIKANYSTLKINKIDTDTKKPLDGVKFKILKSNGEVLGEYTTNKNGIIEIKNLYPGSYTIKETYNANNYQISEDEIKVTLNYKESKEVTITNEKKKGNLKLIKIDSENKQIKLEGVEFQILDENNKVVKTVVTNKNGEALIENLEIGKYTIKETKANDKYILADDKNVIVEWNNTKEVTITNEKKKGNLKLIKIDSENKQIKLEGVEFQIIDENNKVVKTVVTNKNGEALIENLEIGKYTIKETKTNDKYILADDKNVIVEWNNTKEVTITNEKKKGNLKLIKIDSENKQIKLEGVEFQILDENNKVVKTVVTNKNGEAVIENLEIGKYTIKETKTNDKYILADDKNVIVEWNDTKEITITNEKIKGKVKILKISEDYNKINGKEEGTKLKNVKFEIYDEEGILIDTIITNEEGIAESIELEKGKYYIIEVETNEEYILNEEKYEIEIEKDNQVVELTIKNKSKEPVVPKLPRTGF